MGQERSSGRTFSHRCGRSASDCSLMKYAQSSSYTTFRAFGNDPVQPSWSMCRWVCTTTSTSSGCTPARASSAGSAASPSGKNARGFGPAPVSTNTSVSPDRGNAQFTGSHQSASDRIAGNA